MTVSNWPVGVCDPLRALPSNFNEFAFKNFHSKDTNSQRKYSTNCANIQHIHIHIIAMKQSIKYFHEPAMFLEKMGKIPTNSTKKRAKN